MLTVDRITRPHNLRKALALAIVACAGLLPASASAERPLIKVDQNKESATQRYGDCTYRVQAGYFGTAAYVQVKLLSDKCVWSGIDNPDTSGSSSAPGGGYVYIGTLRTGEASPYAEFTPFNRRGPAIFQADDTSGRGTFIGTRFPASEAAYRVCSSNTIGWWCDSGRIDVFPYGSPPPVQ